MIVGYARTSTIDQEAGFNAQREQLLKAGCEHLFQEQVSAVARTRPQLQEALLYVRAGDIFVVTKLDRLCRSVSDFVSISELLAEKGVTLQILAMNLNTDTPTGKLMLNVLASVAEFERQILLERQKEGINAAKAAGRYKGRKATARMKTKDVLDLRSKGLKPAEIGNRLGMSIASVYRCLNGDVWNATKQIRLQPTDQQPKA